MIARVVRGAILNPTISGSVDYFADGVLAADEHGAITFCGNWAELDHALGTDRPPIETARGILCPPFLDAHIHVPQHPIRGKFTDGIGDNPPEGRLLAGLLKNVFPAEGKFSNTSYARQIIKQFSDDTLAHGVVGGAAYLTVHADAAEAALESLHRFWSIGPVLMNQNCPEYLRNDEFILARIGSMAARFGRRVIVTDRFAVAVDSTLRILACAEAERFGLRTQTHLNEQRAEKVFVEQTLYPNASSYTNVYLKDGLLDHDAILAHCIQMTDAEFDTVANKSSVIAHCPTSNTLLGSGVMPLDRMSRYGIDWAICTDVGASPTTSLLAEMSQFLKVHAGRSRLATPSTALYRITRAPAKILELDNELGRFAPRMPLSFVEIKSKVQASPSASADEVISKCLLDGHVKPVSQPAMDALAETGLGAGEHLSALEADVRTTADALEDKVISVTIAGRQIFRC
jgi:guanine deaminase